MSGSAHLIGWQPLDITNLVFWFRPGVPIGYEIFHKLRSHKPEDFGNVYWVPGHLRPFHTCRIGCTEKDQKISLKTPAWWTPSVQIHGITIQWLKSEGPDGEIVASSNVGYGFHYKHFYKLFYKLEWICERLGLYLMDSCNHVETL